MTVTNINRKYYDWLLAGFLISLIIYYSPIDFGHGGWPYRFSVLLPIYAASFYFLCYVVLLPYGKNRRGMVIGSVAIYYLVFSLYFVVVDGFDQGLAPVIVFDGLPELFVVTFYLYVLVLAFSVIYYWFLLSSRRQQQQEQQILQQERFIHDLSQEKIFRQNLFNAHRTRNFLGSLLSRVHKMPEVSELVKVYAQMLTYSMSLKPDQMVNLAVEVRYIESYIALEQMITPQNDCVKMECAGPVDEYDIYPRLLVTLVENAFHHGKVNDPEHPVEIKLVVNANEINFYIRNRKDTRGKLKSGIGKVNLEETLRLYYPDRHDLRAEEDEHTYTCILTLDHDH